MKRRVSAVLLCVLAAAGLLWPLLPAVVPPDAQSAGPDPVSVTSYDATYDVAADGRLVATESLTTAFPFGRHGIFRYWDVSDRNDASVRYQPDISSITLDGAPVQYETTWDGGRRYFVAKIGDPDRFVTPGTHVYRITYAIDGTISPVDAGKVAYASTAGKDDGAASAFVWNVVAQGWLMDMGAVHVTVHLPTAARSVQCSVLLGTGAPCRITGAGTSTVTLSATDVPALSGMSTRITSDAPAPARTHLPWPVTFDQILGTSVPAVVVVAVLCVLLFALGVAWARRSREPVPGLPVMYAPPAGLGPVQTVYVDTEGAGGHALVASLLYLAERDVVALEQRSDDTWLVTGKGTPEQWAQLDPVSRSVGESLGVTSPGLWFLADKGKGAGQQLSHATTALQKAVGGWAVTAGVSRSDSGEKCAKAFWYLTLVLAAIGFTTLLGPSMYGLPLAAFAIGGVGLSAAGVGMRRTPEGRRLWSEAGGFERLLSTSSAEDRFDFAARKDLFIAFIPYAVAFGVADRVGAEVPDSDRPGTADTGVVPRGRRWRAGLVRLGQRVRQLRLGALGLDQCLLGVAVVLLGRGRRRGRRWRRGRWLLVRPPTAAPDRAHCPGPVRGGCPTRSSTAPSGPVR